MALREGKLALPFAGGVNTDQDRKQVPAAKLLDLQNAVFTAETTLVKRTGYRALGSMIEGTGALYSGAKGIGRRDDELLLYTTGGTYSYRPQADRMALTGSPLSITARERTIVKTGTEQTQVDAATVNNVTAVAWVDSRGGIWWALLEDSTGRQLKAAAQLTAVGTRPRVVPVGGTALHIYYADFAAHSIWVAVIDSANPTLSVSPSQLTTDLNNSAIGFDACPAPLIAGQPALITWMTDTPQIARVAYVAVNGVLGSVATSLPSPLAFDVGSVPTASANVGVTVGPSTIVFGLSVNGGDTLAGFGVQSDLSGLAWTNSVLSSSYPSPPNWRNVGVAASGDDVYFVGYSKSLTTERDSTIGLLRTNAGGGTVSIPAMLRGLSAASRPFFDNGAAYVYLVHDVPFFSVYLLVRLSDYAVVARTMPTIAHGTQDDGSSIWTSTPSQDPMDSRKWRVPLLFNEQLTALVGQFAETGIRWVTLDFDDLNAWQSEQLGRGLYLAGALPWHYDANRWAEAGWNYAPDGAITTISGGSGTQLTAGTYTYVAWYEEVDGQGEIHRGPTSVPFSVTVADGEGVNIIGPMYRATSRQRVRVCVARAISNTADAFYRVTSLSPAATGANGYVLNDPTVDTWSFLDRMGDDVLLTQEPLYTNDGILSNDPAPMAGGVLSVGKNRLFWTDPTDQTMVRYSQELEEGFAVDFAEPLKQKLDPFGGDVTAIGIMDDTVYPFRATAVYAIGGPGPLPNPTKTPDVYAFTPGQLVTSDVGCVAPQSVVQTPVGIAFKTSKGIRMLGRDRRVVDIGSDVRAYDGQSITAATLSPIAQRITFLTSSGSTLHFDYQRAQWSRFTNHEGLDALILGGLYYYLRTDGRVFVETPGLYQDDNSHIPMVMEMAWLKMAGYLQGWQRIWYAQFLGEYKSPHTLRIRYRLNYEYQWSAPFDLDVNNNYTATAYGSGAYGAGPYGSTGSSVYQRRIHLNRECQAIQFQIQDVEATTDFGAAFELSELVITGGIKGNLYKMPATRSN